MVCGAAYEALGGFPTVELMEDYALVMRVRQWTVPVSASGSTEAKATTTNAVYIQPAVALTSSRRWIST